MLDTLLSGPFVPFTLSLALLFGLLVLEVTLLFIGGSLMGDGAEADLGLIDGTEVDIDLGDFDLDGFDIEAPEFDLEMGDADVVVQPPPLHPLAWLGFGKMPTLIWMATVFMSFAVAGIALQALASVSLGGPIPALLAAVPSAIASLWFTRHFGTAFAAVLPKSETQSVSIRQLGRRNGLVTQGTATRGTPAEVRVTDRYGNTHYLRAEPLHDADVIVQGAEVLVLRHRPTGGFRLIAL